MALQFKQVGEYDGNIVTTILKNREVEDIPKFLNPDNTSDTNPFDIDNLLQGAQILSAHLAVNSKMVVVVDADADGYMSASIIYQYIKKIDKNFDVDFVIHDDKAHGLTEIVMDELSEKNYDLVIIPDASSNDGRQIELLYAMGAEVLVLDHHIIEEMPTAGIIVNNQIGDKANKNLVGAGIVYRFCQAMDSMLKIDYAEEYVDLAAIGQIGDSSDISENEVRNMVFNGIKNINNSFLKEALKKKDVFMPVPKDLSFSVIPMINAVIRVGTHDDKKMLFRAINNIEPELFEVQKKKKNKSTGKFDKINVTFNLQQMAVDIALSCKSKQDRLVKKAVAQVEQSIWEKGGIAIGILEDDKIPASVIGLIATKIVPKLQKPVLVLREKETEFTGSGRGYEPTMNSLKDWCQETNQVNFAKGHDQAFGLKVPKDNMTELRTLSETVEAKDFEYEVDYVSKNVVDEKMIKDLDKNKHIFGGKVSDPLFAYTGIVVPKKNITAKGTMLTFFVNGVEFVVYGATNEIQSKFTDGFASEHTVDFIGRPGVNDWMGKEKSQVVVEAVDFSDENLDEDEITPYNIVF